MKQMSYSSEGVSAMVIVDRSVEVPLHRQVYQGYRAAILSGKLRPGQMVPSSREFAADHGYLAISSAACVCPADGRGLF